MGAVVGVGHDDDALVTKGVEIEVLPPPQPNASLKSASSRLAASLSWWRSPR